MIRRLAAPVVLLLAPATAFAHSPIKGLGDFYNGILHPLFVPAHVLLVVATGLLLGQQGVRSSLHAVWAYLGGVVLGLLLAGVGDGLADPALQELLVLGAAVPMGLLVVMALRLPTWLLAALGGCAGLVLGLDSLQTELTGKARIAALFGSGVSLYLLMLYPMALAESFQRHTWLSVGVRILASWITASALLVLALLFAPTS